MVTRPSRPPTLVLRQAAASGGTAAGIARARAPGTARWPWASTRALAQLLSLITLLLLLGIVGATAAVLAVTGRGTFFDEAVYLVAGKTLVFRGENWNYETWFVGSPFAFPQLAGVIESMGGSLVAVRMVNVGFLLVAVWAVKRMSDALGLRGPAALLGAAAFGLAGPVLYTGGFATYDMPALAATALAFWLALRGTSQERPRVMSLLAAGLLFALAVITKYIVIVLAPVLLGLVVARLMPLDRPVLRARRWVMPLCAAGVVSAPAGLALGLYLHHFWWQLRLVFLYGGGHTTNYGATGPGILAAILLYLGPAWLLALVGLREMRHNRRAFAAGLVLVGGSLVIPLYHVWRSDPLALFKQVTWSVALTAPLVGLALTRLARSPRVLIAAVTVLALLSVYHVTTLRAFYPDPAPAAAWLQAHVNEHDDPILVDDVWPYRLALADTFDTREWWVTDQWWWRNEKATPELWRGLIQQGTFSYIVFERGGAFNGEGSVFDQSVVDMVEQSGRYQRVASFPSRVTWGNAILPPPFRGQLRAYSVVDTEVWARVR